MTFGDPRLWLDLIQFLITMAIGIYVWQANRHRASREQIENLRKDADERLDSHRERLMAIEENQKHQPQTREVVALSLAIERINGELKVFNANLDGINEIRRATQLQVDRMDEFLRNNG